jgi:hypothetical protein
MVPRGIFSKFKKHRMRVRVLAHGLYLSKPYPASRPGRENTRQNPAIRLPRPKRPIEAEKASLWRGEKDIRLSRNEKNRNMMRPAKQPSPPKMR